MSSAIGAAGRRGLFSTSIHANFQVTQMNNLLRRLKTSLAAATLAILPL